MRVQAHAPPWHTAPGRLPGALLIALILHGALLFGLGFTVTHPPASATSLEVTLALHPTTESPPEADLIAVSNQVGSGDHNQTNPVTSDQTPLIDAAELRKVDPLPRLQQPPPGAESVEPIPTLSRAGALHRQMSRESSASPSAADEVVQVQEIASLRARLDLQKQAYNRLPRTLVLTAASARRAEEADYLYRWTEWVERVGNEHYPDEARRRQLFGDLRLAVAISRDGNVENVEILASSGQPILDQAAVRIVRLAAPFAPIPSSISADRIEVIRTWRFMPGEVFASQAE